MNLLFLRNFKEKVKATVLTDISYQCQCLQDSFVLIQHSDTYGTALELRYIQPFLLVSDVNISHFHCGHSQTVADLDR